MCPNQSISKVPKSNGNLISKFLKGFIHNLQRRSPLLAPLQVSHNHLLLLSLPPLKHHKKYIQKSNHFSKSHKFRQITKNLINSPGETIVAANGTTGFIAKHLWVWVKFTDFNGICKKKIKKKKSKLDQNRGKENKTQIIKSLYLVIEHF